MSTKTKPQKKKTPAPAPTKSKKRKRDTGTGVDSKVPPPVSIDFAVVQNPPALHELNDVLQSYVTVGKGGGGSTKSKAKGALPSTDTDIVNALRGQLATEHLDLDVPKAKRTKNSEKSKDALPSATLPNSPIEYPILNDKTQIKATEITKIINDNSTTECPTEVNPIVAKLIPDLKKVQPVAVKQNSPSIFIKSLRVSGGDNQQSGPQPSEYGGRSYVAAADNGVSGNYIGPKTTRIMNEDCDPNIRMFDNMSAPQQQTLTAKIQASVADKLPFANITSTDMKKNNTFHIDTMMNKWHEISTAPNKKPTASNKTTAPPKQVGGQPTHDIYRPDIPCISREYIRGFLREAIQRLGERPCMLGPSCVSIDLCLKHPGITRSKEPFPLREFLLPSDLTNIADAASKDTQSDISDVVKKVVPNPNPCILCTRYFIHRCAVSNGMGGGPITLTQNHGNRFNCDGEYAEEAMLTCGQTFSGIVVPVMRFDMTDYVPMVYDVIYKKTPGIISKLTIAKNSSKPYTSSTMNTSRTSDANTTPNDNQLDSEAYNRLSLDLERTDETTHLRPSRPSIIRSPAQNNNTKDYQLQRQKHESSDIYTMDARGWAESSKIIYDARTKDFNLEATSLLTERLT